MKNYYTLFTNEICSIIKKYPFVKKSSIGTSVKGRDIPLLQIGSGCREILFVGVHHGLEGITADVLLRFVRDYAKHVEKNTLFKCLDAKEIYKNTTLYVIPVLNPDGLTIASSDPQKSGIWQANANGVDLNHNYNARWADCKKMEQMCGITSPGPTRYGGEYPESEPESHAAAEFVRAHNISRLYAFHSQGEVIYWTFDNLQPPESRDIAAKLARVSGYELDEPEELASCGGLKDWFISEYRRPGFTIEIGKGTNPLPPSMAEAIYRQIAEMMICACML